MNCEFLGVGRQTTRNAVDELNLDGALDFLLSLDVVHVEVGDDHSTLLDPLVHVHFFDFETEDHLL